MFKRILIPTDGSKLSRSAVKAGIELARFCQSSVALLNVQPPFTPPAVADIPVAMVYSPDEYEQAVEKAANKVLADVKKLAVEAGVDADTYFVEDSSPYEAIIRTAKKAKCDLIFMASHGRRGLSGLLLGSETHKVLTHCKIPVLVHR